MAALTLLAFSLAACSDASGPTVAATGVYQLETINGLKPPVPLGAFYNYTLEYTSSQINLNSDNSFHIRSLVTERVDGNMVQIDTIDDFGLWKQKNSRVVLTDASRADSLVSTLANNKLSYDVTQDDSLYHYVYRRQ